MGSYRFSGTPTTTDVQPVRLSAEERDFLDFLLYQHGDSWIDNADGSGWHEWYERLQSKLS